MTTEWFKNQSLRVHADQNSSNSPLDKGERKKYWRLYIFISRNPIYIY